MEDNKCSTQVLAAFQRIKQETITLPDKIARARIWSDKAKHCFSTTMAAQRLSHSWMHPQGPPQCLAQMNEQRLSVKMATGHLT